MAAQQILWWCLIGIVFFAWVTVRILIARYQAAKRNRMRMPNRRLPDGIDDEITEI